MKKRASVKEIMTQNLKTISLHNGTIQMAKDIMEDNNIRHLPVISGNEMVGIISLSDILSVSYGANFGQEGIVDKSLFQSLPLEQVMVHNPTSVTSATTIKEAAEILASSEFHALPVVEESKIEGIVTSTDLIKYLIQQY